LISVLLIQSAGSLLIVAGYEINKEYISNFLCINRSKPEKKCNGKCHLNKELKNEQEKEKKSATSKIEKQEIVQFVIDISDIQLNPGSESNNMNFLYHSVFSQKHTGSVFHPPTS
jgi:hypothetical protein